KAHVIRRPGSARFVVRSILGDAGRPAYRCLVRQGTKEAWPPSFDRTPQLAPCVFPRRGGVILDRYCLPAGPFWKLPTHRSHDPAPVDDACGAPINLARFTSESAAPRFAAMGGARRIGTVPHLSVSQTLRTPCDSPRFLL